MILDQADELVDFQLNDYINSTFTPELEEDISVAFQLLYAFELPDPEIDFLNLITSDSYLDSNDMHHFNTIITHKVLYLGFLYLFIRLFAFQKVFQACKLHFIAFA